MRPTTRAPTAALGVRDSQAAHSDCAVAASVPNRFGGRRAGRGHPAGRRTRTFGLITLLATSGCCDLAAFFCGPDKSPWVPISFQTPRQALATFMEAVRRDNVRVICESLSPIYKEKLGIPGCFEAALAWERVAERAPHAHLLGRAEVTGPEILSPAPPIAGPPRQVRYVLEVGGYRFSVELARHAYAGASYLQDGAEQPRDQFLDSVSPLIRVETRPGFPGEVVLRVPVADLPEDVSEGDVLEVKAGHEWKIVDLSQLE